MQNDIYREELLEYYRDQSHRGTLEKYDIYKKDANPICGDTIEIFIKINHNSETIEKIHFNGDGCVISIASAAILTEFLEGKKKTQIQKMLREDMLELLKLQLTPTRMKCALLALNTIKKGIIDYESKR